MKSITANKQRIFGLDVVRALAILLILCSHSTILIFPESESILIKTIQFFGTIGVDLFFVLSGFLIGGILIKHIENKQTSFKHFTEFWMRRWLRTLPNYYLILLINIGLLFVFNTQIPKQLYKYFFFLQNFSNKQSDFFTESWSLTIEEFAYLIGPILLFLLGLIFKKSGKWLFLGVTLLVISSAIFYRFIFDVSITTIPHQFSWSKSLRKVVVYRLDSVYYGFLAAFIAFYYTSAWKRYKWLSFGLGVVLFVGVHVYIFIKSLDPDHFLFFFNVYYLSAVSISILLTFPLFSNWRSSGILQKPITTISLWSYSIYLVNYSIVLLSIQHCVAISDLTTLTKLGVLVGYWSATFVLSYLLFSFFEYPIIKFRDSARFKRWITS
ncbi:acyltransferase family protein [Olleya sp. HaHaR_3_96]|uniref:acyltransferase family protein n=1 Tax=Olleya sp. HaHaR_3_96 TaxID=2745560 RepID=UPI001C4EB259|nr:acyltransferase [Olleya sp. HaHaR_3_96]QXP61769.1 acyltransferase [Olleya sp. HaHaR_3_96]